MGRNAGVHTLGVSWGFHTADEINQGGAHDLHHDFETLGQALERHPERVIEHAVKGMLPKNPLGRAMYKKLKVYKGSEHPHAAQQPQVLDI